MDSNPKTNKALESQNPNKIQTAKIQDSKIQLESNPKDLAKLESNSPKLKDSKVSKTSKDSMKLESSPKLDSKTSQKSNSKSKPPKIQRAKTSDSKKPTNSQKSKIKSFIRTIPISIALASALSSQAVAGWNSGSCVDTTCTVTSNVSRMVTYTDGNNFKNLTINAGVTLNFANSASGTYNALIGVGGSAGIITNYGTLIGGNQNTRILSMQNTASIEAIINTGLIQATYTNFEIKGSIGSFVNQGTGTITNAASDAMWERSILYLGTPTSKVGDISFEGSSLTSAKANNNLGNIVFVTGDANGEVIKSITAKDNADLEGNFTFNQGTIGNITFQDSAKMTGNISLEGNARITNGITIGGNSSGGSGNNASLAGNITIGTARGNTASIDNITISDGGTYAGTIHTRNQTSIGGITIANGGVVGNAGSASTILSSSNSTIHNIDIQDGGTMYGNIGAYFITGASNEQDSSGVYRDGNIGDVSIAGRLQGDIVVNHKGTMDSLTMSGNGTITGNIIIGKLGNGDQTPTLGTITLNGNSGINAIILGNSNNARATINSLTLEGTSSIGTITNNSNGTISNIALNGTSTITNGITNASGGTISNITLASSNTIHSGITNNGVITEINHNVAGVENAVTNNAGGSISRLIVSQGTIEYNGDGAITKELSVAGGATLSMNNGSGTITMNGAVGSKLNLESGSTFKGSLKNTGSIDDWDNVSNIEGSFINDTNANIGILKAGQITGTLLNKGNIGDLTIDNVVGTLNNESEITTLSLQSEITQGILNSGNIQTLTLDSSADLGSVGVSNRGVITSLNNHKAGMQITNTRGIGTLAVDANTTYVGDNGNISQELVINQGSGQTTTFTIQGTNQTLTLGGTGNGGVKTITNEGTIIGNLINTLTTDWIGGTLEGNFTNNRGAILQSLSNGTITGNLINAGSIVSLTQGTIGTSLGNQAGGIINTLHSSVVGNLSNAGVVKDFIVDSDMDYTGDGTIANSMTILNNNTLNIGNAPSNGTININFGASATGTIGNAGTINGNITNLTTSTIKNFVNESTGKIDGDIINRGIITSFTNSGSFEGNLTNDKTIENLTTGAITGNITNAGSITTLIASGNVTNGITNNADIGSLIVNESVSYSGTGSISNALEVAQGDTLTIGSGSDTLNFHATNGTIKNAGIINGTIDNKKGSSILEFDNSGSITGIINNGHIVKFTNYENGIIDNFVNNTTISFFENNGVIKDFSGNGIIYGVLNSKEIAGDFENVATSLQNTGTITGNVQLIGNQQNCKDDICQDLTSDLINEGIITGTFTNTADKEMDAVQNTGVMGGITNEGNITTINTGSITGSIANSGEITTLNVTGNVDNGITNTAGNIANLTIDKGFNLGTNGITNNAVIGNFTNNANITYRGSGSITGNFSNASDSTITLNDDLILKGNGNTFNNDGILKGTISNIGALSSFTNTGSITGLESGNITGLLSNSNTGIIDNLVVNGNVSQMQNAGTITSLINNFSNTNLINAGNIGSLDIQKNLNYSGSGSITNSIDIARDITLTTNGITLNATKGSVNNLGILAGALTLAGSSNSVTNSGSITTIINNASNSILTNNSNIGSLKVYESVTYTGNGSDRITQALEVAKNKTLTIQNSGSSNGTLSFNSKNGSVNNLGIIEGNLLNVSKSTLDTFNNSGKFNGDITNDTDSTITNFTNSGTITGDLYNDGHIDTLHNTGTMGTIYNRSKNTIKELRNDKNSVIARIDNSNGRYNTLENQGTILGDINNNNGTITNLVNTNNGTITGQIISNGNSNIGTIANAGVINSSHTINDTGSIQDKTNDAISLNTISNVVTAIANSGSINGNVRVAGNSEVDLIQNSKIIAGCIILEGGKIGNINNTNGAIANCMSFSSGANVDNITNEGTIKDKITNDSGSITINNGGSGSIGGITTSNGGTTTIINGGKDIMKGGHIGTITNDGSNSNTHIDGWTLDNPDNPSNPIIIADGSNTDGIHLKENSIFVSVKPEEGKIYNYYDYIQNEKGDSIGQEFSQDDELFDALTFIDILKPTDNGDGTYSLGLDTKELSGKTLGASLIYSSRMRQINTNSMLREINVKNFKTDFEILEQRERLKNQQALLENYKQQRQSYLNGLTKDNKELKRVSSKESTSLSTYANNSNIKSDAIEVVDYYNEDTLASLDNLQATTKANQETYSNLDLLRELDDIFISHTGDKDNLYTFALPYTRYTSAQLDGGVGTLKSHASGILAGAQAKLPSERGILGIYFGYESSDKQVGQQRLDFDEKVYYGGLTYYNVFARKGVSEYYLSANTRIDKGDTNLYKTYRSGSTTIDSQVDSYGYGADLKVGANYYNIYNNSVISPEIGISYQGISTDSFRLRHLGGVSEHYYTQDVNFFDISASLRWQRAWNNVFKTMASLGAMYNVYNDAKGSGVIAGLKQSADINVEELYGTTQVGISYALGENANIALNYSGIFANGVQSHAGYIRLGVWW